MRKIIRTINKYPFTRNLVLALCAVIVFVCLSAVMLNLFTRHNVYNKVPDFRGMKTADMRRAAKKASVRLEVTDSLYIPTYEPGIVLDQQPEPGTQVKPGRRVFLKINSAQRKKVELPYVTGYSLRQAKNVLEMSGLEIEKLIYRSDIATNNILEERYGDEVVTPTTKKIVEVGTGVTLIVGQGPNATAPTVPKVVGFPLEEAKSRIWEAGLNVGKIELDEGVNLLNQVQAKVWMQSPDYPQRVALGRTVDIKLTLDDKKVESGSKQSEQRSKSVAAQQAAEEEQAEAESVIEQSLKGGL